MINSVSLSPQTVAAGNNVLFAGDRVRTHVCRCNCGWLEHDAGSGLYTLTKAGVYKVDVSANVSLAAAGNVALAIQANGETVAAPKFNPLWRGIIHLRRCRPRNWWCKGW